MWEGGQVVWVVVSHATVNKWWERHVDTKHGYEQYFGYVRYQIKDMDAMRGVPGGVALWRESQMVQAEV